ncbi:histidine triad nucleotide-binding protein [Candidatus Aerophobetes bacterium]|uniref:Histidine triad nucleotide-binding protein n=1 Tax=Aerophobetes bacterium TaxID=2030807 RepID=A0A2A4X7J0_UNCAE|nr:MAG: histidine triad nucleotide-binding protein [Candidatus Aerophobetes bacterium]
MSTIFEQIVEGTIPSKKVFETEHVLVIEDMMPKAPVHLLIITKKLYPNIQSIPVDELSIVSHIIEVAQSVAKKVGVADNYRLVTNSGKGAGQTVFHLHFHLLGGAILGDIT